MASHSAVDPTAVLADAAGVPVAPHVATRLARAVRGDAGALGRLGSLLSAEHLAGRRFLPGDLPWVPTPAEHDVPHDDAGRRLALCVAVAVVDRVDVLRRSAGAGAATVVALHDGLVELRGGRFRVLRPEVVAWIRATAEPDDLAATHRSWARAARQSGDPAAALWHTAAAAARTEDLLADGLLELAVLLRDRGDVRASYAVAREAARHGVGVRRDRALAVAGTAATWSGHLVDAEELLLRACLSEDPAVRETASGALDVVRALASAPARPVRPARARTPPGRRGPGRGAGASLARAVEPLVEHVPGSADRDVLRAVVAALDLVDADPDAAAEALAGAAVDVVPAPHDDHWSSATRTTSPLAEAHLRVVQALLLLCADQGESAAAVLDDACARLPVSCVVGGLAAEVAGVLDHARQGRPGRATTELQRLSSGSPTGVVVALLRSVAVTRARSLGQGSPRLVPVLAAPPARVAAPVAASSLETAPDLPAAWSRVLTAREADVVGLVVQGLPNRAVAQKLCVSVRTVEVHLGHAYRKLSARSRSELVVLALRPEPGRSSS